MAETFTPITTSNLTNQTSITAAIDSNFSTLATLLLDVDSLSGSSPNSRTYLTDMNSKRIINLPPPASGQEPLRLQDAATLNGGGTITTGVPTGGTTNQLLAKGSSADYDTEWYTYPVSAASGKTAVFSNSLTLAGTDSTTMTFPSTSDTVVTLAATQTLTNKTLTSPTLTTPASSSPTFTGTITFPDSATYTSSGFSNLTTSGPLTAETLGFVAGFATGTVTQATSKGTAVTLNTIGGKITTNNSTLSAATIISFQLNNSSLAATDIIIAQHISGGTVGAYTITTGSGGAGYTNVYIRNATAGSLSEAIVIQYVVIKAQ